MNSWSISLCYQHKTYLSEISKTLSKALYPEFIIKKKFNSSLQISGSKRNLFTKHFAFPALVCKDHSNSSEFKIVNGI